MVPFSQPINHFAFCRYGDDLLSQTFVHQQVRTKTKYPRSEGYRQSLCAFILSLIIRKSQKTMQNEILDVSYTGHFVSNRGVSYPSQSGWECTYIGTCNTYLIHIIKGQ